MKSCSVQGCASSGEATWDCCAFKNMAFPLCKQHDITVNAFFLSMVRPKGWQEKLDRYAERLLKQRL